MSTMIQAEGLTKHYGRVLAIDDVSFSVEEGEVVAFLGPNAAGKTTTMRILTGFTPATMGNATIAGHNVRAQPLAAREHIGYMPETMALYPELTVQQYLSHCAKLRGVESHDRDDRIEEVAALCSVEEVGDTHCGKLSKGYRQRVGLAQALIHDPDVLILDEPTIGLDPVQIRETRRLIKGLGKDHTVMLSTHILPEAQMTCERVIIIANGQIVAVDTPANLAAQIRNSETLYLKVRDDSSRVPRAVRDLADVMDVEPADDTGGDGKAYLVNSEMGMDIREQLSSLAVQRGWGLLEMRPVAMTLEDVYLDLTTEEEGV
ncbi:MAG: ABC transporter ATP-binding protein [Armatimonadota bacterium]|jgi:ABC-2 type transport system ATP-binding protein